MSVLTPNKCFQLPKKKTCRPGSAQLQHVRSSCVRCRGEHLSTIIIPSFVHDPSFLLSYLIFPSFLLDSSFLPSFVPDPSFLLSSLIFPSFPSLPSFRSLGECVWNRGTRTVCTHLNPAGSSRCVATLHFSNGRGGSRRSRGQSVTYPAALGHRVATSLN